MASYSAVMVKKDTWVEIAETILNLDLDNPDVKKLAYLKGLVRAEVGEVNIKKKED